MRIDIKLTVRITLISIMIGIALQSSALAAPFSDLTRFTHRGITVAYQVKHGEIIPTTKTVNESHGPALIMTPSFTKKGILVSIQHVGSDLMVLSMSVVKPGESRAEGTYLGNVDMGYGGTAFFPGDRHVYTRVDGVSRKFRLNETLQLEEVVQPFLHLNKRTQVKLSDTAHCGPYTGPNVLRLSAKQDQTSPVIATLPMGTEIEVILRDGDWFLIKTPFGLTGWAKTAGVHSLFGFAQSCVG